MKILITGASIGIGIFLEQKMAAEKSPDAGGEDRCHRLVGGLCGRVLQ